MTRIRICIYTPPHPPNPPTRKKKKPLHVYYLWLLVHLHRIAFVHGALGARLFKVNPPQLLLVRMNLCCRAPSQERKQYLPGADVRRSTVRIGVVVKKRGVVAEGRCYMAT